MWGIEGTKLTDVGGGGDASSRISVRILAEIPQIRLYCDAADVKTTLQSLIKLRTICESKKMSVALNGEKNKS